MNPETVIGARAPERRRAGAERQDRRGGSSLTSPARLMSPAAVAGALSTREESCISVWIPYDHPDLCLRGPCIDRCRDHPRHSRGPVQVQVRPFGRGVDERVVRDGTTATAGMDGGTNIRDEIGDR